MNGIASSAEFVFAMVLMLGVVVTVHELGHFWAAKACGVRVLKFSIGFGNPIGFGRFRLRWQRRGTEYVIAWLPLGGFVKMLGENPGDEESPEALASVEETLGAKPTWQKLAIVFAGPAMNLVLPVFVFAGSLFVGIDRPAAVIVAEERELPVEPPEVRQRDAEQANRRPSPRPRGIEQLPHHREELELGARRLDRARPLASRPFRRPFSPSISLPMVRASPPREAPVAPLLASKEFCDS